MRSCTAAFLPPPSTSVVLSLSTTIFLAEPSCAMVTFSRLMPDSSEMNVPPVSTAMSPRYCLRRSPKPGALTAQTLSRPRRRFTTSAARASFSTSSAMIRIARSWASTCSRIGSRLRTLLTFFSWIRM
jgi:hypothetical protein